MTCLPQQQTTKQWPQPLTLLPIRHTFPHVLFMDLDTACWEANLTANAMPFSLPVSLPAVTPGACCLIKGQSYNLDDLRFFKCSNYYFNLMFTYNSMPKIRMPG